MNPTITPGLEGIIAAETRLSRVDGLAGELIIAGFPLEDLAPHATFEEVVYLLWQDRLPDVGELCDFRAQLSARRDLPAPTLAILRAGAAQKLPAMDALRMAAATLSLSVAPDPDALPGYPEALMLVASFPTLVAAYWRLLNGEEPIAPRADLGHAANTLYMLTGMAPDDAHTRALETYLNTVVDHGFNASTFTARVIISTQSDMISAIVGALGALKGPLHGGAPGPALDMVFEIGRPENAEAVLRAKLDRGERLMGFGHRVYKVRDPRAEVLGQAAEQFFTQDGAKADLYHLVRYVEDVAVRLLEEYKPGRHLQTNVEFYTALLLHGLNLPTELFSPTFAIGRVAGWTAHGFEQMREGRLIRPKAAYAGETDRRWIPVEDR